MSRWTERLLFFCVATFTPVLLYCWIDSSRELSSPDYSNWSVSMPSQNNGSFVSVCERMNKPTKEECDVLTKNEKVDNLTFPLQYVSGALGSGNDWIMWMTFVSMYTWPREKRHDECEVYHREDGKIRERKMLKVLRSKCLFFKSHEPWVYKRDISGFSVRGALLLRHPYDSAFAEYKRRIVEELAAPEDWKQSTVGISVDKFINVRTKKTNYNLMEFLSKHTKKWLEHARYWLLKYRKPLHVIIYNTVKENPAREVENLQRFFGYRFNGANLRRHCCVMENPLNPKLKRNPTEVDKYKELIYNKEVDMREKMENAIRSVQRMLFDRFPHSNYTVSRG